ncbi:hypothetical protein [Amphiplicatus metriothermophilus]|uniref:Uncharacterized protein n=1 Tax=Amphiplicatus metriothermophilus TaxID=1519374 RepID=A0A239PX50_9PROT|nr:hypothetical protein [Amphiplicatus metriothermophilus]MBB5520012.1 hypothetical protein [Amphiplicatus metriothermophilus]SNT74911.1 hypothetical protein SAMN06297382_2502 [Amphiplicatus metriothermophilus]
MSLTRSKRGAPAAPPAFWRKAGPAERAGYIEEMTREMANLAAGPGLERLRDLLRLAEAEARRLALGR